MHLSFYRTINELEAHLDYERLRPRPARDMADLSYRLQAKLGDDSDSESDAGYGHQLRQSTKQRVVKKRSGLKKRSQDEGGVFIKRNVSKEKRGARYQKVV
ncbi:hypothetical protein DPMN_142758 [Dreissena polymorpha]|uniref:Uncharacterized protein n=1 Tax=Dreissena polymorpha TaxID=45954 RepID=A0A9D4JL20_DREPO|nr:hypothetical protein DPMN_142758 [Dreissena polymorpha]